MANDSIDCAKGKGTCTITMVNEDGEKSNAKLNDVLFAPNIHGNIISVGKLMCMGFAIIFNNGICEIKKDGKVCDHLSLKLEYI